MAPFKFQDLLSSDSASGLLDVIQEGDVIRARLTVEEEVTPKKGDKDRNKFFIVLGKTTDNKIIGFTLINSKINGISAEIRDLNYPLSNKDYTFLSKERSYVYCGEIKEIELAKLCERNWTCVGNINANDLEYIKNAVISSPAETPKRLKKFGLIP